MRIKSCVVHINGCLFCPFCWLLHRLFVFYSFGLVFKSMISILPQANSLHFCIISVIFYVASMRFTWNWSLKILQIFPAQNCFWKKKQQHLTFIWLALRDRAYSFFLRCVAISFAPNKLFTMKCNMLWYHMAKVTFLPQKFIRPTHLEITIYWNQNGNKRFVWIL